MGLTGCPVMSVNNYQSDGVTFQKRKGLLISFIYMKDDSFILKIYASKWRSNPS
jgi:hypothetical protein